ncbi:PEP-CTERM sorting domain-containing protein [Roseiarcus sp.]|uniref:PEP-CTERM sorting domain-containing protein n=1 Tax=Roseiarcus sp. TaxID=1969460 RepID=UPI003C431752
MNLLANGDFSGGVTSGTDIPKGWTYVDPSSESGLFLAGSYDKLCVGNVQCWSDGTAQGYDGLSQSVNWKSGDQYTISFVATVNGAVEVPSANPSLPASNATPNPPTWLRSSTNSGTGFAGNAVDLLAYIGNLQSFTEAPPLEDAAPEPSTWVMMLLGFVGLGFLGYRRAKGRLRPSPRRLKVIR